MAPRQVIFALIALVVPLFAEFAIAEGELVDGPSMKTAPECNSCIDRKKSMCADECSEVTPIYARECQLRCIQEYCNHRCAKDAPQFSEFQTQRCEDCLNDQFTLCEKQCPTGTPRSVAECKVKCSAANCQAGCK